MKILVPELARFFVDVPKRPEYTEIGLAQLNNSHSEIVSRAVIL